MTDLIRYDLLVQNALKGVVRRVLTDASRDGLPGEHHFYVSFRTDHAAVRISSRLRERYPNDMTIVLQHQFDALKVEDWGFEVGLSFSGIPERLRVPFDALTGFFDPSVQFGLKFEAMEETTDEATTETISPTPLPASGALAAITGSAPKLGPRKLELVEEGSKEAAPRGEKGDEAASKEDGGGEVVSLDSFRKKS